MIANIITIVRIIIAVVVLVVDLEKSIYLMLVIIACFSDWLDGFYARYTNTSSVLGSILDPLADKFFITAILLKETYNGTFLWYLPAVNILRDTILIIGYLFYKSCKVQPSSLGKFTTAYQMCIIIIGIILGEMHYAFQALAAILLIVTILDYYIIHKSR